MDLFTASSKEDHYGRPLADSLRPSSFEDFFGQKHFMSANSSLLKNLLEENRLWNLILWGPPGSGKTTFGLILSRHIKAHFLNVNAVETGVKALREMAQSAKRRKLELRQRTILFVDEIHRFSRSQQDVLLPSCENGDFVLVGATTENPSYELTSALLSRCQVLEFKSLEEESLVSILDRACTYLGVQRDLALSAGAQKQICLMAGGDARKLLNFVEVLDLARSYFKTSKEPVVQSPVALSAEQIIQKIGQTPINYDKSGDEHYNCISAFIKSLRGSDADAGLYYLARMIEGGEDPVFIARRMIVFASEDIGNADPRALLMAVAVLEAVKCVGMPEARINLAQVVTYLSCAPKSNRSYVGLNMAQATVRDTGALSIPKPLRSGGSNSLKALGIGVGYVYPQEETRGWIDQSYLPEAIKDKKFYEPSDRGFEKNIASYQDWIKQKKQKLPDKSK